MTKNTKIRIATTLGFLLILCIIILVWISNRTPSSANNIAMKTLGITYQYDGVTYNLSQNVGLTTSITQDPNIEDRGFKKVSVTGTNPKLEIFKPSDTDDNKLIIVALISKNLNKESIQAEVYQTNDFSVGDFQAKYVKKDGIFLDSVTSEKLIDQIILATAMPNVSSFPAKISKNQKMNPNLQLLPSKNSGLAMNFELMNDIDGDEILANGISPGDGTSPGTIFGWKIS